MKMEMSILIGKEKNSRFNGSYFCKKNSSVRLADKWCSFLRARDIVAYNKGDKIEEPLFISYDKYNAHSKISGKVEKGDLLVTGVGTIGIPFLIKDNKPLYFKDGNIIWLKIKKIE